MTGDIADRGLSLLVRGNHDVDRRAVKLDAKALQNALLEKRDEEAIAEVYVTLTCAGLCSGATAVGSNSRIGSAPIRQQNGTRQPSYGTIPAFCLFGHGRGGG